jgi:hypothetical protein
VIGRSRQADLPVAHALVSRQHCQLFERDGILVVKDNGSLNGTFVGGQRVDEMDLRPGDELTVGPLTFQVYYETDAFVPTQDATSTPADDSTVASPPKRMPAPVPLVPAPADPGQSPTENASPFDFLESEAAAPADQAAAEAPDSSAPAGRSGFGDIDFGHVELGHVELGHVELGHVELNEANEPLSLPEPRVAQEATLQWSDQLNPVDETPAVEMPAMESPAVELSAAAVPPLDAPPVEAPPPLEAVADTTAIVAPPEPQSPADQNSDAEPADFFASLALEEASPSTASGNAETEFFVRPPSDTHPEPEVRDADSTIIEPQPRSEPSVALSESIEGAPPVQSAPKEKQKGGGWWPFGKKKTAPPVPNKPLAQTPTPPVHQAIEPSADGQELPDQSDFEPADSPATDERATVEQPGPAPGNLAPDVLVEGTTDSAPAAAADNDLVAGWLADEEPQSGPGASGSDLNNFLTNFPK